MKAHKGDKGGYVDQVGSQIKRARTMRGWSQRDLAKKAKVTAETVSSLENGLHEPRPSTLRKLAGAFGVEVADLFGEARPSPKVLTPPSLEWARAASDEEFDGWVEAANLNDILMLNYELSEAVTREPFGSDRHSFMWGRLDKVIARFRRLGGYITEPEASVRRRARLKRQEAEDAAAEAG